MALPTDYDERKQILLMTGVVDYFLDALMEVALVSVQGNKQHCTSTNGNLVWDRSKSKDEINTALRHLAERGEIDNDGRRHTAKAVWRVLAELQKEIEQANLEAGKTVVLPRACKVDPNDPFVVAGRLVNHPQASFKSQASTLRAKT